jgi:hypothetical protein
MVGVLFGLGSLLAICATLICLPTILSLMAQKRPANANAAAPFVSRGMMLWSLGGIAGYIAFGFIADRIGRRGTVIVYSLGTIAAGLILYLGLDAYYPWYPVALPVFGFFVLGVFSRMKARMAASSRDIVRVQKARSASRRTDTEMPPSARLACRAARMVWIRTCGRNAKADPRSRVMDTKGIRMVRTRHVRRSCDYST